MIGVSRGSSTRLSKKDLKKQLSEQSKLVPVGELSVMQLFCTCELPIEPESYHVASDGTLVCDGCFYPENLDLVTVHDLGFLIHAPELTQQMVNAFALAAYYTALLDDAPSEILDELDSVFNRRRDDVERIFGDGVSSPVILAQFLYTLSDEAYLKRGDILSEIRLFPSESLLAKQINFLSFNELKKFTPQKWVGLLQKSNEELKNQI